MYETYKFLKEDPIISKLLTVSPTCWECQNKFTELHLDVFLYYYNKEGYTQHYGPIVYCPHCKGVMITKGNCIIYVGENFNLNVDFHSSTYISQVRTLLKRIKGKPEVKKQHTKKKRSRQQKKTYKHTAIRLV